MRPFQVGLLALAALAGCFEPGDGALDEGRTTATDAPYLSSSTAAAPGSCDDLTWQVRLDSASQEDPQGSRTFRFTGWLNNTGTGNLSVFVPRQYYSVGMELHDANGTHVQATQRVAAGITAPTNDMVKDLAALQGVFIQVSDSGKWPLAPGETYFVQGNYNAHEHDAVSKGYCLVSLADRESFIA